MLQQRSKAIYKKKLNSLIFVLLCNKKGTFLNIKLLLQKTVSNTGNKNAFFVCIKYEAINHAP